MSAHHPKPSFTERFTWGVLFGFLGTFFGILLVGSIQEARGDVFPLLKKTLLALFVVGGMCVAIYFAKYGSKSE